MEFYLLSEPKIRGYRKQMLSLWLNKGMFWVSIIVENNSYKERERSTDDTGSNLGEEVRDIVTVLEAD